MMSNSLKLTCAYKNTDYKRTYKISDIDASNPSEIKSKIKALNASLAGGTSGGLDQFLRSEDFDSDSDIGTFSAVSAAQIDSLEITPIDLDSEGDD